MTTGKYVTISPEMQFSSKLNASGKIIIVDGTFKSFSRSTAYVDLAVDSLLLERAVSYRSNPEFWENLEIVSRQGGPERTIDDISIIDDELEIVYADDDEDSLSVTYSPRSYFTTEIYGTKFMGGLARHFQSFDFTLQQGLPLKLSGYFVSFDEDHVTVFIDQGLSMAYTVAAVVLISGVAYLIAKQTGFAKMPNTDGIKKSITDMAWYAETSLGKATKTAKEVLSGQISNAGEMIAALPKMFLQNQLYSSVIGYLQKQAAQEVPHKSPGKEGGGSYYTIPIDQSLPFWKNLVSKKVLFKAASNTVSRRTPSRRTPSRSRTVSRRITQT